jgi:elongation factor Ts
MAEISAQLVKELREATNAGILDCKKALAESNGNFDQAVEFLRKKGLASAAKKAGREANEGIVGHYIHAGSKQASLVELNCETDFVTKNDSFLALANAAAKLVAEHNPVDLAALGALPYSQDSFGPTLEEVRKGLIGKIGENMSFRRFKRAASGAKIANYLHGTRIGVLVEYEGDETAAKDVAMHVAAMKPVSLTSAEVPADLIEKERSVAAAKAAESGKPADIVTKMVEGSVQKYLKEVSLFNQSFVKNDKQTVEQMLKASGTTVKAFTLFVVGEGIEKKVDDFAAEVAAQVAAAQGAA